MATIRERLDEFYCRLAASPPAHSADEALTHICRTLDEVEDELSGLPKQDPPPPPSVRSGRMYPPQADMITRLPDGSVVAGTRRHSLHIGADGSIAIVLSQTGDVEFTKPGAGP
jgi:hypothetical protein